MSFTFLVRLKRNNFNKTLENSEKILYIVELVQKKTGSIFLCYYINIIINKTSLFYENASQI